MMTPRELKVQRLEERIELLGDSPSGILARRQLEELRAEDTETEPECQTK